MDSHGRQKATHKLLELTKDPDVASIARGLLCEKGAAPVAERAIETKIPRGDWILLLLGIPIAIIFFLRTTKSDSSHCRYGIYFSVFTARFIASGRTRDCTETRRLIRAACSRRCFGMGGFSFDSRRA